MDIDRAAAALRTRLACGSALASVLAVATAHAQPARDSASAQAEASRAESVQVVGQPPEVYKSDTFPTLFKLTQPNLDTPTITPTITRQVMQDEAATSLADVFRNASGISLGAGESSWQGTNLTLRGFNARNDLFLDGMRDFGSYYRDPFNLEEVEVLQGPSSFLFGRGSTGGAINQVSKTPTLAPHLQLEAVVGTDETHRGTIDLDTPVPQLGEGAAFRLNLLDHENEVAGRDEGHFHRTGVAPSLALGLGTPTRLTLSWFHQAEDNLPDYGIPWLLGKPAPVPRDSFYGFESDYQHLIADVSTVKLEHDFNEHLTFRDQVRYADYGRHWRETEPQAVTTGVTAATPLTSILINRSLQGGHSHERLLDDQTDLLAKFDTGFLHHTVAMGFELAQETSQPEYDFGIGLPRTTLIDPDVNQPFSGDDYARIRVKTDAFTASVYAVDTIAIGRQLEITGGVRYDNFRSDYEAQNYATAPPHGPTTHVSALRTDDQPSYRAGIVYKPVPIASVYFDYSTSFNPSAEALSQIVAVRSLSQANIDLSPEKNRVYEAGAKAEVLGNRLLLQGAVFREIKYNARIPDPTNSMFNILGGDQQVDGFEVEAQGRLTDRWQLTASYTNLHGQVIRSGAGGPAVGQPLFNAPDNAFDLFTTYQLTSRLAFGGGLNLVSRRYGQITNPVEEAPGYVTGNVMAKYQLTQNLRLQVNVYNLSDADYADALHGFHIIPGAGRSALFTVAAAF
ncbi:MAG: TonB-dependent siderophore receptor [Caulobacteraceae bacterium]|nr:TonB-dependent siderophore receptor [Caulobacter sp.]